MDSSWIRLTTRKVPWYKRLLGFARGRTVFINASILGGGDVVAASQAA